MIMRLLHLFQLVLLGQCCFTVLSINTQHVTNSNTNSIGKIVINPFLFGSELQEGMRSMVLCTVLSKNVEPSLSFLWLKDGKPLQSVHPDASTVQVDQFTTSLTLSNIERRHAGNYTCRATSANHPHIWSTFTLVMVVLAGPKWVLKPDGQYSVLRGRRFVMDCQAEGIPAPIHQWKKRLFVGTGSSGNGGVNAATGGGKTGQPSSSPNEFATIASGPHMHVLENGSLSIIDATKADQGDYACEVVGNAPSYCGWTRDRQPLATDKYIRDDSIGDGALLSRIILNSADISDSGFYTCTAANSYGSDEKKLQLVVQGPPESPYNVKATDVKNRWVTLQWSEPRNGNSPLLGYFVEYTLSNATWSRGLDGIRAGPKDLEAKLIGLFPDSHYKVRVIAQNAFGNSQASVDYMFKTDMEAPSEVPTNIRAGPKSATTIKIVWKAPTYMKVPQKVDGYYVGYREQRDTMTNIQHPSSMSGGIERNGGGGGSSGNSGGGNSGSLSTNLIRGSDSGYTFKAVEVADMDKHGKQDELELTIHNLKRNSRYAVIVQAFNKKGSGPRSEEVVAQTFEFDPPPPVIVRVLSSTRSSITIAWESNNEERTPIGGYVISVKSETSDWAEHNIAGYHSSYVVDNLSCGTRYYISVCPFNKAGRAQASPPLHASTAGTAPRAPTLNALLASNSTFALLRLNSWLEQQCSISYFVVQYKVHSQSDWIMLSNNIIPEQGQIIISDLIPATWYDIIMIGNSKAGQTKAQYVFSTLTLDGATISPPSAMVDKSWGVLLSNPLVVMPVLCTAVVALVIVTLVVLVARRNCSNEIIAYSHQAGGAACHELHYSGDSTHKCENMTMSSFNEQPMECYPLAYATCQLEQKLTGPPSATVHSQYGLTLDSTPNRFRSSTSDHTHLYDVPQRPVLDDNRQQHSNCTVQQTRLVML